MLQLKNITFNVRDKVSGNKKDILKDVNLRIDEDNFVVITGPNGSGKSTLAKIIMGIEQPSSGEIYFYDDNITSLDITQRAKLEIGLSFQQPVRFKGLTVKDLLQIAFGKHLTSSEACSYLSEVGLSATGYIDRDMDASLSGGEIKRIEIAMLMARKSKLSLFDEPEAGIDLWSFNSLVNAFKRLKDRTKGAVVIISHQKRILEIADKIIVMVDGKIAADRNSKELLPILLNSDGYNNLLGREV